LHEIDHQWHSLEVVALTQAVLEVVRVVPGHVLAGIDLHGESRRALASLGHVEQLQAVASAAWWLAFGHHITQEPVQLRGWDATSASIRGATGAERAVLLDALPELGLAPKAGGVDQLEVSALERQRHVDRVARCPGELRHDHPLVSDEAVDERGLADIRSPDNRESDR